jgi:predicted MFS family arabinose efflux permease
MSMATVGYIALLRQNSQVRWLWLAQVVSELGDWLSMIAVVQLINLYTTQARAISLVFMVEMLPMILLTPWAGATADRFDRTKIMIVADLVRAAVVLLPLFIDRSEYLWIVYFVVLTHFSLTAFFEPARSALLATLASGGELLTANALMNVTWSSMLAIGSALGGLIVGLIGINAAFITDCFTFLLSATFLWQLSRHYQRPREVVNPANASTPTNTNTNTNTNNNATNNQSVVFVLRYLRQQPRLLATLFIKLGLGFTAGAVWLLSITYGQSVFPIGKNGTLSVGILYGLNGLGSIIGAALVKRSTNEHYLLRAVSVAFLLRAVFFFWWGSSHTFLFVALAILATTAMGSILWVTSTTLVQNLTYDAIRGRVFGLETMGFTLGLLLSTALIGQAMDVGGYRPETLVLAIGLIGSLIFVVWYIAVWRWSSWPTPLTDNPGVSLAQPLPEAQN